MKSLFTKITPCLLSFVLILAGCFGTGQSSDKESQESETSNESSTNHDTKANNILEELEAPEIPTSLEDLPSYSKGPFANVDYYNNKEDNKEKVEKILDQLPVLTEENAESEKVLNAYWHKLYSLFAKNYKDPESLLDKWKLSEFGNPDIEDPRYEFKENFNAEIILDASGSMAAPISGESKMEIAKEAVMSFADSLPEEANVGLRVYGHKGSSADSDKELSCDSSELVYDLKPYDKSQLEKSLNQFEPKGWTPIARSLKLAKKDLSAHKAENNTNMIFLISDGIETCDGDPAKVAKQLSDSDIKPLLNVIGFDVDNEGQQQLKNVAEASDGTYVAANNQEKLEEQFNQAQNIAKKWEQWKKHAEFEALNKKQGQFFDITQLFVDNKLKLTKEKNNIKEALAYLKDNNKITDAAADYIKEKEINRNEKLRNKTSEMKEKFHSLNEKNYKEMKEAIQEEYNKSTDS